MSAPHGHGYRTTARLKTGCIPLLAAVLGLCISTTASAFSIGHARIESGPNEQLQFSVLIRDVPAEQREDLQVQMAPVAAWQELGLRPQPEVLEVDVRLQPGPSDNTVLVRFHGQQPVSAQVVDALIDVNLAGQQQRHQVSMLQQPSPTIALPARHEEPAPAVVPSAAQMAAPQEITVRTGDTLHAIAQRIGSPHGSEFQVLAALYRLNPEAFSHQNMNLLLAGETLVLPDADQIQRLSDTQARHKYMDHLQRFNRYKEALARGVSDDEASKVFTAEAVDTPIVDTPVDDELAELEAAQAHEDRAQAAATEPQHAGQQDRLRLAEATEGAAGTVAADEQRAQEKALAHVEQEVAELESRVDALGALVEQADGAAPDDVDRTAPDDVDRTAPAGQAPSESTAASAESADTTAAAQHAGDSSKQSAEATVGQPADAAADQHAGPDSVQSADATAEPSAGVAAEAGGSGAEQPAATAGAPAQDPGHFDSPQGTTLAQGQGAATGGDTAAPATEGSLAADAASSAAATVAATASGPLTTGDLSSDSAKLATQTTGDQDVSWLQAHFIKLMLALLLFIVIFTIWILRRANKTTVELESPDRVTPEMIQAKLDTINLDLEVPPSDEGTGGPAQPKS